MSKTTRLILVLLVIVIVISMATNVLSHTANRGSQAGSTTSSAVAAPAPAAAASSAVAHELAEVPNSSSGQVAGYDRVGDFGPAWQDVDHNGCSTRDDILARDLTSVVRSNGCKVLSGLLADPYTGKTINFRRGVETSAAVQIDHVVPLHYAWNHGAASWTSQQRLDYANSPTVLLAADGPANEAKGDSGPAGWMPANHAYACAYVTRFVSILHSYKLSIDAADRTAITATLSGCPAK